MSGIIGGSWMKGPNRINAKRLVFMGACQRAVNEFRALFGDQDVLINLENVTKLHEATLCASLYCVWLAEKIVGPVGNDFWREINGIKEFDPLPRRAKMVDICMKYLGARHVDFSTDESKPPEPKSDPVCQPPSPPV